MTGNYKAEKQGKKINGRWSKSEHQRFLRGYQKFGRNWVQVQKIVKTRSLTQVRSHAQKMFLNMEQNGLNNSIDSDNSDQISYQDTSESQNQMDSKKIKTKLKRSLNDKNTKNQQISIKSSVIGEEIKQQKILGMEQQSTTQVTVNLPQKQALYNYLFSCPKPSHFMVCLSQQRDFFNNGGNFLDLCVPAYSNFHNNN